MTPSNIDGIRLAVLRAVNGIAARWRTPCSAPPLGHPDYRA